jgi:hypothetical protein
VSRAKALLFTAILWALAFASGEGLARAVFALRGLPPPDADPSLAEEWSWAAEHLRRGQAVLPGLAEFDPSLGWRLRPNLVRDAARTNAAGMRGEREFAHERAPGRRRLLLVGDSYTFGSGVRDDETFAAVLAGRHLPGWEVLNLAVPGYGTDQQVLAYEHSGRRYRPDVVVLGFFVRDYGRNLLRFRGYAKPRFELDDAGELRVTGSPVPAPEVLLEQYRSGERQIGRPARSYLVEIARGRLAELRLRRIDADQEGWRLLAKLMERFAAVVRESGAEPLWVLLPGRERVEQGDDRFGELEPLCEAHARRIGLAYLSLTGPLQRLEEQEPAFRSDDSGGHLSVAGHREAARAIFAAMRARGWTGEPPLDVASGS